MPIMWWDEESAGTLSIGIVSIIIISDCLLGSNKICLCLAFQIRVSFTLTSSGNGKRLLTHERDVLSREPNITEEREYKATNYAAAFMKHRDVI